MDQRTRFRQVSELTMIQHLFTSYVKTDEIDLEENVVKMMGPCHPAKPLDRLMKQLENGREFARAGGKTIDNEMMVSKWITLFA